MAPTHPRDIADMARLHAMLRESAERAQTLAAALARMAGCVDDADVADFINEALAPYWAARRARRDQQSFTPRDDVSAAREETAADARRPQDLVVDILRELEGEATIPQLLNVLDDMGHQISANHLSVLLTRLAQSGVIERIGRGRYRSR